VPAGFKEVNSQGDAVEMLSTLVEHGIGGVQDRLDALVELVAVRLLQPNGALPFLYLPDWRPSPDVLRVGYSFMMARILANAASRERAIAAARAMTDFALRTARHPGGGYCIAVTGAGRTWPATGPVTDLRQWWVQLEAAHTLHVLAADDAVEPDARERYRAARDEQWDFVRRTYFDERYSGIRELPLEGGWRSALVRRLQGTAPSPLRKMHPWKDPLHEVGTFLALAAGR
jgi:mannose/cellobiose epimerase-like protein (N-acyl-D-glucosamine 2-epimerase family)